MWMRTVLPLFLVAARICELTRRNDRVALSRAGRAAKVHSARGVPANEALDLLRAST